MCIRDRDSEDDFGGLFSDIDLASPKLGKTADDKNTLVSNVLLALDDIDFGLEAVSYTHLDVYKRQINTQWHMVLLIEILKQKNNWIN